MFEPGPRFDAARAMVEESAARAGRDPATIGMEARVTWVHGASEVAEQIAQWRELGASHVSVNTMGAGFTAVGQHLDALERVAHLVAR
jgi:alkanesulfonate monooxygenase SsuD/methylene tetrahydromethanopterin reductase-like flavin-dependent oxidoreductase (luciferase family)